VILTCRAIDDLAMKYIVEAGAIGVRRVDKGDLRRIAKLSGAEVLTTLMNQDGDEEFTASQLGTCGQVQERRLGDDDLLFFTEL